MLTVAEAVRRILGDAAPLPAERVPLDRAAGRVLAADLVATSPLPAWASSAMDGYAVRGADVRGASVGAPVRLRVTGTIAAGSPPGGEVGPGEARRIMTGAPIPPGADTVVRVEDTDGGTERVEVRGDRDAGRNLRPAAQDAAAGDVAIPAGTRLDAGQLAFAAALGVGALEVRRRPRVAVLGSGDELALPGTPDAADPWRVVATNNLALVLLAAGDGADVVDLGIAPDDAGRIARLAEAAAGCDLLVTTGGASVGAFDLTHDAMRRLGLELDFRRVRVRPGSQTAFGRLGQLGGIAWLGLPGNPVSAQVSYELFVRPWIRARLGMRRTFRQTLDVVLDEPARAPANHMHLLRARIRMEDGVAHATLTGPQGTGLTGSMSRADALVVVPDGAGELPAGSRARALLLRDDALHGEAAPW